MRIRADEAAFVDFLWPFSLPRQEGNVVVEKDVCDEGLNLCASEETTTACLHALAER